MKLKDLLSVMIIHRSNFEMLHWKVKGQKFDSMHNTVTTNYYEMISTSIDDVAELGLRLKEKPVNYLEAYREAKRVNPNILIVDSSRDYTRDEVISTIDVILKDILASIGNVIFSDDIQNVKTNVGIKAALESMYNDYDKE